MHILRIADAPDNRTGGMTRAMYGTGDILAQAGHQVDYWFSDRFPSHNPTGLRRFTFPLQVAALIRQSQRQGQTYDVVEIHEPSAAAYCFLRRFNKSLPPVAIFSHGLEERGHQAELEYRAQKGLPISAKKRFSPLSVILQARYAARRSDQVLCTNSADLNYLAEAGVPENRLSLVHNGVDESLLAAGDFDPADQRSGLLFVGSWLVRKGILDLIPAASAILRRHSGLTLTVAGSGAEAESVKRDFPEDVRHQIAVIPSFSGNQTLIDLYRQHSIFILPSYFEGQPLVMIEAAAFGMAIVTTNVCGMSDFIEDGRNGLLINPGDAAALEDRLETLIIDPVLAQRLGQEARKTAKKHTWTQAAKHLLAAYERAIDPTRRRSSEREAAAISPNQS